MKYLYGLMLFLFGILIQWACSTHFSFFNLAPQVLLVLTIAIASRAGAVWGQNYGFFWGLFLDVMGVHLFGVNALTFTLIAYLVGTVRRQMDVSSPLSQIMVVWLISMGHHIFLALIGFAFERTFFWVGWSAFCFIPLLNCLVTPVCFYLSDIFIHS